MSRRLKSLSGLPQDNNLLDQVEVLAAENARLRQIIVQHGLENVLHTEKTNKNNQLVPRKGKEKLSPNQHPAVASNDPSTPKGAAKGCSCKGKCITRICGCVKKDLICSENCKCSDALCENQNPNKENVPVDQPLSPEEEQNLQKMTQLSLKEEETKPKRAPKAKNKAIEAVQKHPGLFSPEPSNPQRGFDIADFESKQLQFGKSEDSSTEDEVDYSNVQLTRQKKTGRNLKQQNPQVEKKRESMSNVKEDHAPDTKKKPRDRRSVSVGKDNKDLIDPIVQKPLEEDITNILDPMKPRPKLVRSPIVPRIQTEHSPPLDISELPLPAPPKDESFEMPASSPEELNEPIVDWDKHQAERVRCKKCGRGFYPHRIKKHESSCQKI